MHCKAVEKHGLNNKIKVKNFATIVDPYLLENHKSNFDIVLPTIKKIQKFAFAHTNISTTSIFYDQILLLLLLLKVQFLISFHSV